MAFNIYGDLKPKKPCKVVARVRRQINSRVSGPKSRAGATKTQLMSAISDTEFEELCRIVGHNNPNADEIFKHIYALAWARAYGFTVSAYYAKWGSSKYA